MTTATQGIGEPEDRHIAGAATPAEPPVLRGLARTRLSGKEIAAIVGVSAPTVSKWRRGRTPVPAATQQFLTLLLAERMQAMIDAHRAATAPLFHPRLRGEVEALKVDLDEQEAINALLPARALHDGARRFRDWLHAQGWLPAEAAE